jgi:hypothetical protein
MMTTFDAMKESLRGWRIIGLALLLATLAGCAAMRLVYRQADELLYWWADGYADFTDAQAPRVRAALDDFFEWHRRTQLPVYAERLARLQPQALADTTPAAVCALRDEGEHWAEAAWTHALPAIATLVPTLEAAQFQHIQKRFDKVNRDFRNDFAKPDAAARHQALVKRTLERAERLYGRFDTAQRERIGQIEADSPFDAELAMRLRQSRQQDVLQTLRGVQGADPARAQAALRALAQRLQQPAHEDERRWRDAMEAYSCELSAQIHNLATPEQRRNARERLHGWETDFRVLSAPAKG